LGGAVSGALVRDIRLANELADRGYEVHAWWAMDRPRQSPLRPSIREHWLFHGARFAGHGPAGLKDLAGRTVSRLATDQKRAHTIQKRPEVLARLMHGLLGRVCDGVEGDRRLVARFARQVAESGVTHMLPMLELLCPWVAAAIPLVPQHLRYLVTFQGYEVYANYARDMGCEQKLYARLAETASGGHWPSIAVSADYLARITADLGIPAEALTVIPPGIPVAAPMGKPEAVERVRRHFPDYRPDLPLVAFLGRRDSEKGIDLLLYAANILRRQGRVLQVAVCGPTAFGGGYADACRSIAEHLRLPVLWAKWVSDEARSALLAASRCLVYPSIHGEPFGMVPVEALAQGTPAVVPDHGGVASAIRANGEEGGLLFRSWDSGDLALQIGRLLDDDKLWQQLSEAGLRVARYYSVQQLGDRMLVHLGLPAQPEEERAGRRRAA
jgi:glycosyltransferase involved in cell wall biosynthesis